MSPADPSGAAPVPRDPAAAGGDPPGLPAALPPRRDPLATALQASVVVAFLAVLGAGIARIQQRVRSLEDFRVDLSRVRVEAPDWLPAGEVEALRAGVAAEGSVALMKEGLPEFVAGRLAADPRVLRVLEARRLHPDAVEVVVQVRRPVALVEMGEVTAAVDGEGIHLPGDYRTLPLPRIRGAGASPVPGGCSFGPSVVAGASVAAALPADLARDLGISVLDVSGVGKGGGVVLRAADRPGEAAATVEWGRAPASDDAVLDPSPTSKVARLRLAARRFPGLRGLRSVRLGFDELVVVPL